MKSHQAETEKILTPAKVHSSKDCGFFYVLKKHKRLVAAGVFNLEEKWVR